MKIDGVGPRGVSSAKGSKKAGAAKKAGAKKPAGKAGKKFSGDKIEVSDHIQTLEMIRGIVETSEDIRADEVDRIMSEMKNGQFKINFEKVAEGFIKEALLNEISSKGLKKREQ